MDELRFKPMRGVVFVASRREMCDQFLFAGSTVLTAVRCFCEEDTIAISKLALGCKSGCLRHFGSVGVYLQSFAVSAMDILVPFNSLKLASLVNERCVVAAQDEGQMGGVFTRGACNWAPPHYLESM